MELFYDEIVTLHHIMVQGDHSEVRTKRTHSLVNLDTLRMCPCVPTTVCLKVVQVCGRLRV